MQFLYVLTSTPNDTYYEQFLLSIVSLKIFTPNAKITLLCDKNTKESLIEKRNAYENIVSDIIIADVPATLPQIEISRWLKTSMRKHIKGNFLFIDCDTVITEDLSSIFNQNFNIGACLDKHLLLDKHSKKNSIIDNEKKLGFNSYLSNRHYNSGVIYSSDTPESHNFFNRWHELWLFNKSKNIVRDQPSFNMAIQENIQYFTELDGTWNCQIAYNGLPYLASSKIIHYFATDLFSDESPYSLASPALINKIKETGSIPIEAMKLLENPKSAFTSYSRIISGDALNLVNSAYFESVLLLMRKLPFIFNFLNGTASLFKRIIKALTPNSIKHYK